MKSRITIEVDFDNNRPVLSIVRRESDDVRDKLVAGFFQSFGGESMWCRVNFFQTSESDITGCCIIYPIRPTELEAEKELIEKVTRGMSRAV